MLNGRLNHKAFCSGAVVFSYVLAYVFCVVFVVVLCIRYLFYQNSYLPFKLILHFLQVYDWDKSSRNDFLGCARLNLGGRTGKWDDAVGAEREAWQKIINEPNIRHEVVIPLRSSTDTRPLEE